MNAVIRKLLNSKNPSDRKQAVYLLAREGTPEAVRYLAVIYKSDPDPLVRQTAVEAGRDVKKAQTGLLTPFVPDESGAPTLPFFVESFEEDLKAALGETTPEEPPAKPAKTGTIPRRPEATPEKRSTTSLNARPATSASRPNTKPMTKPATSASRPTTQARRPAPQPEPEPEPEIDYSERVEVSLEDQDKAWGFLEASKNQYMFGRMQQAIIMLRRALATDPNLMHEEEFIEMAAVYTKLPADEAVAFIQELVKNPNRPVEDVFVPRPAPQPSKNQTGLLGWLRAPRKDG